MSKRRLAVVVAGLAVVTATFVFVLPRVADYGDVWRTLRELTWEQIGVLAAATVLNVVTFAPPYVATLPGLGFTRALLLSQASTASTYVAPGGSAVGIGLAFAMLRGWGFATSAVTLSVAITGAWNQLFMLGAPAVALALLTVTGGANPLLQSVALIGLVVFVVVVVAFAAALAGDDLARSIGDRAARLATRGLRLLRRAPVAWDGSALVGFRLRAMGLLRRRWWAITLATIAGHLTVFVLLVACLRTLGVSPGEVTLVEAFAGWTLVRLLGSLPFTPGGVGVVELGLTGALVGFGGKNAEVVAAVLLYRVLTIVPTLVLGLLAGTAWRRLKRRREPSLVGASRAPGRSGRAGEAP